MSPPLGSSSLITSAPRKARICVQAGPAWLCVISMMRIPDRAFFILALPDGSGWAANAGWPQASLTSGGALCTAPHRADLLARLLRSAERRPKANRATAQAPRQPAAPPRRCAQALAPLQD